MDQIDSDLVEAFALRKDGPQRVTGSEITARYLRMAADTRPIAEFARELGTNIATAEYVRGTALEIAEVEKRMLEMLATMTSDPVALNRKLDDQCHAMVEEMIRVWESSNG